jgi:hypothetical protein
MRHQGVSRPRQWFTKLVFALSRRRFGRVLLPLRLHAHSLPRLAGMGVMMGAQKSYSQLSAQLSLLAQTRVAALVGCDF